MQSHSPRSEERQQDRAEQNKNNTIFRAAFVAVFTWVPKSVVSASSPFRRWPFPFLLFLPPVRPGACLVVAVGPVLCGARSGPMVQPLLDVFPQVAPAACPGAANILCEFVAVEWVHRRGRHRELLARVGSWDGMGGEMLRSDVIGTTTTVQRPPRQAEELSEGGSGGRRVRPQWTASFDGARKPLSTTAPWARSRLGGVTS